MRGREGERVTKKRREAEPKSERAREGEWVQSIGKGHLAGYGVQPEVVAGDPLALLLNTLALCPPSPPSVQPPRCGEERREGEPTAHHGISYAKARMSLNACIASSSH